MDGLRVEIEGGFIQGEILSNELDKKPYRSFKGVPYARPPVGPLRFKPPEPVEKWDGTLQCTEERNKCWQHGPRGTEGSEDCLYLNVFSPLENSEESLRPVIVMFHGGAFQRGEKNTDVFGPDFLIRKGVVIVIFNYRLNIFGFLNLGIEECPGNVGLKDQRAVLIWVKKHIQKFNGDPENVTICGRSAGSVSVHYQLISPLSKGLYHKAILQSGCCFDPWGYMDISLCIDKAFQIGKHLGCRTTDVKELHKFLLDVPAEKLLGAISLVLTSKGQNDLLSLPFVPSKEIVGAFKNRFLTADPKTLNLDSPEVPILCGLNSAEGLLFFSNGQEAVLTLLKNIESAFDDKFPEYLKKLSTDKENIEKAKTKVKRFYMRGDSSSDSVVVNNFADFDGDILFNRGNYHMLKTYLSAPLREPFYLYLYDFESEFTLIRYKKSLPVHIKGACHGDDRGTLFYCKIFGSSVFDSKEFMRVVENMTTICTNFAKFGNPNPNGELKINWEPLSPEKMSYCKITEKLEIQPGFIHEERMKFWDELYLSLSNQTQL